MTIDIPPTASGRLAVVDGRLDLRSAPELRSTVGAAIAAADDAIVLDLSAVEFIDSSGLGVLVGLHREAERRGVRMLVVAPSGSAAQIFTLTRTMDFFTFVTDREAGNAALTA